MSDKRDQLDQIRERALVALTYLAYDYGANRGDSEAVADKELLLKAYDKADINDGAMTILSILLNVEAHLMDKSLAERIDEVRGLVIMGLRIED